MPRQDPQSVYSDPSGNVYGAVYGNNSPGDGLASETFRTERGPVADVKAHGAEGDGATNDTTAFHNALSAADANDGTVYVPPGTYQVNDSFVVPEGVRIEGAGINNTTIRSTYSGMTTFEPEPEAQFIGFTLDQNTANRGRDMSVGIRLQETNHVLVDQCNLINISDGWEGKCIEFYVEETDSQDVHSCEIRNSRFEGNFQNGDNSGDFLIRGRTNFGSDLDSGSFTRKIRHNTIDRCFFTGQGKAAIEWVGPATVRNTVTRSIARDFTTCTGVFESSLGGKHNTFDNCGIYHCFGDSTCIGFYSDGYSGTPERRSEFDIFDGCRVVDFHQTQSGSNIRAFRFRRADYGKMTDCVVDGCTVPDGSSGQSQGVNISRTTNIELHGMTFRGVDNNVVTLDYNTDPVWNHTVNGGPL